MKKHAQANQTGAAAIYLVLLLTLMFTSSALIISFSLSRQLRATNESADSARAFYAATSGIEHGLMQLVSAPDNSAGIQFSDTIEYENDEASFSGTATFVQSRLQDNIILPCVISEGQYQGQQRRLKLGDPRAGCVD